jgi:ketosteroid isomerase-like protein
MKRLFIFFTLILSICLSASSQVKDGESSSKALEKELRATVERLLKAWNEQDLDTASEIQGDAIGYGYRTKPPRLWNEKTSKAANKWFFASMEIFETNLKDDLIVRVEGSVGLALGSFIEKFKPKGGELQTIEGRISTTFIRADGKWKMVLYHRDTQFAK